MGIFDWLHLQNYGDSFHYTKKQLDRLKNCSPEMRDMIEANIRANRAGGQLPSSPSSWTYYADGLWYNAETNTYSNDPK